MTPDNSPIIQVVRLGTHERTSHSFTHLNQSNIAEAGSVSARIVRLSIWLLNDMASSRWSGTR